MPEEDSAHIWGTFMDHMSSRGISIDKIAAAEVDNVQAQAMEWILCTTLPEDNIYRPVRFHDFASSLESAALGTCTPYAINWQQQPILSNGVNEQLGPSDMGIFSFDYSPLHIISIYDPNASYRLVTYDWTWNASTVPTLYFNQLGKIRANRARFVNPSGTSWAAHGLYLYGKRDDDDNRYFWVDAKPGAVDSANATRNSTVTVAIPGALNDGLGTPLFALTLTRYFNGNPQNCVTTAVTSSTTTAGITFTLNNPGPAAPAAGTFPTFSDFYTVTVSVTATTAAALAAAGTMLNTGVTIRQASGCSILRNLALFEAETLINFFSSKGRVNAQGVRLTDVAMLQYINGQICGATAWDDYSWYEYYNFGLQGGRTFFDNVSTIPGARTLDLLDGGYIYHKPTQATDYNYHPFISWDATNKVPDDCWVPLETGRPVKIIAATAANDNTSGNPTGGGASCYLTVATMIEWIPPVSCYPKVKSVYTRQACETGIDFAGNFPDFTDNTYHWQDFVMDAAKVVDFGAPLARSLVEATGAKIGSLKGFKNVGKAFNTVGQKGITAVQKYARGKRK